MAADELKDAPGMSEEENAAAAAQKETQIEETMSQLSGYEQKVRQNSV